MPVDGTSPGAQPTRDTVRYLIIVARDQPVLWQHLTRDFVRDRDLRVLLDRRHGERRQRVQQYELGRRTRGRRRPPRIETDVRSRQSVIVRPKYCTLPI